MIYLRQSTASQEIPLGRFVDSTDGNTEETALTIANTDIKIWKTGATTLANKTSGGATHIANGEYYCVLDATDTDTIGPLKVTVHVAGALYVQVFCTVLDEAVYDVLFGTTAISTLGGTAQTGDSYALANGANGFVAIKGDTAAILTDTGTTLDGKIDSILADTGTDGVVVAAGSKTGYALTSAYDFAKGTTAVTESYNADGAAPTPVQALMLILQMLTDKSVAGTTLTVNKLDGTTAAATFTLDDGTSPTSITRAT